MNLNEMEIPCDPILDKAKRDELVQNTELLKQVTIKPIPWLPGRDYITTEQVARLTRLRGCVRSIAKSF